MVVVIDATPKEIEALKTAISESAQDRRLIISTFASCGDKRTDEIRDRYFPHVQSSESLLEKINSGGVVLVEEQMSFFTRGIHMIAVFKIEEQRIELGGEEFEVFINQLESEKHIAADEVTYDSAFSMADLQLTEFARVKVIEATTGEWCAIGFEYRTGILWVESEWTEAFTALLKVILPVAVMDPDERTGVA